MDASTAGLKSAVGAGGVPRGFRSAGGCEFCPAVAPPEPEPGRDDAEFEDDEAGGALGVGRDGAGELAPERAGVDAAVGPPPDAPADDEPLRGEAAGEDDGGAADAAGRAAPAEAAGKPGVGRADG